LSERTKNPNIFYISLTLSPSGGKIDKVNSAKSVDQGSQCAKRAAENFPFGGREMPRRKGYRPASVR